MKQKLGLILATMISTAVLAQTPPPGGNTAPSSPPPLPAAPDNSTPATPPPNVLPVPPDSGTTTTNAPVKKKKKHTSARKKSTKAAEMPPGEPLVPGEPAVARQNNVNIRGQARINSEVVGHLKNGEAVTVLEVVTLKHPKTDEPANWAKISLPGSMHVWVNTPFIDSSNETVKARKLNLRTGPGENYSVIGLMHKGDAVKPAGETKGDWTQIEAPTNAFAFVAAHLLTHKAPEPVPPPQPPQPLPQPPTQVAVQNPGQIAPPPSEPPQSTPLPQPNVPLPQVAPPPPPPAVEEPPPPRIVEREGLVGNTVSIQAPSHYELKSLDDGTIIDYLYSTSSKLSLAKYKGLTILVTGEEELDERWPNTPVLTIQKIQVVK